jgi:hypothetical protein
MHRFLIEVPEMTNGNCAASVMDRETLVLKIVKSERTAV